MVMVSTNILENYKYLFCIHISDDMGRYKSDISNKKEYIDLLNNGKIYTESQKMAL